MRRRSARARTHRSPRCPSRRSRSRGRAARRPTSSRRLRSSSSRRSSTGPAGSTAGGARCCRRSSRSSPSAPSSGSTPTHLSPAAARRTENDGDDDNGAITDTTFGRHACDPARNCDRGILPAVSALFERPLRQHHAPCLLLPALGCAVTSSRRRRLRSPPTTRRSTEEKKAADFVVDHKEIISGARGNAEARRAKKGAA